MLSHGEVAERKAVEAKSIELETREQLTKVEKELGINWSD